MRGWQQDEVTCYCAELFRAERETSREEDGMCEDGWFTAGDAWAPHVPDGEAAERNEGE